MDWSKLKRSSPRRQGDLNRPPRSQSLSNTILDYYTRYGQNRDLEKYFRYRKHKHGRSSSDDSSSGVPFSNLAHDKSASVSHLATERPDHAESMDEASGRRKAVSENELRNTSQDSKGSVKDKSRDKSGERLSTAEQIPSEKGQRSRPNGVHLQVSDARKSSGRKTSCSIKSKIEINITNIDSLTSSVGVPGKSCVDAAMQSDAQPLDASPKPPPLPSSETVEPPRTVQFLDEPPTELAADENAAPMFRPSSANSSIVSMGQPNKPRLEWDSLADVGYEKAGTSSVPKTGPLRMSTLERATLRKFFAERGLEFDENLSALSDPKLMGVKVRDLNEPVVGTDAANEIKTAIRGVVHEARGGEDEAARCVTPAALSNGPAEATSDYSPLPEASVRTLFQHVDASSTPISHENKCSQTSRTQLVSKEVQIDGDSLCAKPAIPKHQSIDTLEQSYITTYAETPRNSNDFRVDNDFEFKTSYMSVAAPKMDAENIENVEPIATQTRSDEKPSVSQKAKSHEEQIVKAIPTIASPRPTSKRSNSSRRNSSRSTEQIMLEVLYDSNKMDPIEPNTSDRSSRNGHRSSSKDTLHSLPPPLRNQLLEHSQLSTPSTVVPPKPFERTTSKGKPLFENVSLNMSDRSSKNGRRSASKDSQHSPPPKLRNEQSQLSTPSTVVPPQPFERTTSKEKPLFENVESKYDTQTSEIIQTILCSTTSNQSTTMSSNSTNPSEITRSSKTQILNDLQRGIVLLNSLVESEKLNKSTKKRLVKKIVKGLLTAKYSISSSTSITSTQTGESSHHAVTSPELSKISNPSHAADEQPDIDQPHSSGRKKYAERSHQVRSMKPMTRSDVPDEQPDIDQPLSPGRKTFADRGHQVRSMQWLKPVSRSEVPDQQPDIDQSLSPGRKTFAERGHQVRSMQWLKPVSRSEVPDEQPDINQPLSPGRKTFADRGHQVRSMQWLKPMTRSEVPDEQPDINQPLSPRRKTFAERGHQVRSMQWLKPMTRSEVDYERRKKSKATKESVKLEWIQKEIQQLTALQNSLIKKQNRGSGRTHRADSTTLNPIYENCSRITTSDEYYTVANKNQNSSTSTYASTKPSEYHPKLPSRNRGQPLDESSDSPLLVQAFIRNRTKLRTPEHGSDALGTYARSKQSKFLKHYQSGQDKLARDLIYARPYGDPYVGPTHRAKAPAANQPSSSNTFLSSDSVSIPDLPSSLYPSQPTANTKQSIAIQTNDSLNHTKTPPEPPATDNNPPPAPISFTITFHKPSANDPTNATAEPTITMSEHLNRKKPSFIINANARRQCLRDIHELRQKRNDEREKLFLLTDDPEELVSNMQQLQPQPLAQKRVFSTRQLRAATRQRYEELPEIRAREEAKKWSRIRNAQRLMSDMFSRDLQRRTLRGNVNLSNSMTVSNA